MYDCQTNSSMKNTIIKEAWIPRNILQPRKPYPSYNVFPCSYTPPPPPPTEREYLQLDQICRAVNTSSLKRTSNSFIKLTTLAAMSATVEAKNSSIISRATLRLLAILDYTASRRHWDLTEGEAHRSTTCCQDTDLHEAPTVPFIPPPIINVISFSIV